MLCSVSGIRLPNTALYTFRHFKVTKCLFRFWLEFAGPIDFAGTKITDEEKIDIENYLHVTIGPVREKKSIEEIVRLFYQHMFSVCIEKLLDSDFLPHYAVDSVMLCKIVMCASMQHDSIATVIHLGNLYWSCRLFLEDSSISEQTYDNLCEAVDLIHLAYNSIASDDGAESFVAAINLAGKQQLPSQNVSASLLLQALLNVQ